MVRFTAFRIHQHVFDLVGRLPAEVRQCLKTAFQKIAAGEASLLPDTIFPNLHAVQYCGFTILISITPAGDTAVVVDLVHQRNHLVGIWDD